MYSVETLKFILNKRIKMLKTPFLGVASTGLERSKILANINLAYREYKLAKMQSSMKLPLPK